MSFLSQTPDGESLDQLIELYLLGQLTDDQLDRLEQVLLADPAAVVRCVEAIEIAAMVREAIRDDREQRGVVDAAPGMADFDSLLAQLCRDELAAVGQTVALPGDDRPPLLSWAGARYIIRTAASEPTAWTGIAAVLVVAMSIFFVARFASGPDRSSVQSPVAAAPAPVPIATLTGQDQAEWRIDTGSTRFSTDDAFYPGQRLTLTRGFAELTTTTGARVILEAPCTIQLLDQDNAIRLVRGKLVGVCESPESQGFTVHTPAGRVIDIGTRFGVVHDGQTRVRVLEGQVLASARDADPAAPATRLVAGQSAVMDDGVDDVILIDLLADRFVPRWATIQSPPRVEGDIRFERSAPVGLGPGDSELNAIQLYHERSAVRLAEDLAVTFTQPGLYDAIDTQRSTLAAGTVVDSYIVHLDPIGSVPSDASVHDHSLTVRATIRFDRPILAVVATTEQLVSSHRVFGLPGVRYGLSGRALGPNETDASGLERSSSDPALNDRVQISDDRRTLTLELHGGLAIDQCRVLVASEAIAR